MSEMTSHQGTKLPGDADHTTLSRDNPISEFLRQQKESFRGMSQEEFDAKFQAHMKLHTRSEYGTATATNQQYELADSEVAVMDSDGPNLNTIVLKFTTLSENCSETPSFVVSRSGAKIGREPNNEVCVPSDTRLAPYSHTIVEYSKGSFYIIDCGYDFSASVRIGVGGHQEQWVIESGAQFSAGNSVFRCHGEDIDGNLILEVIEGPLKGTTTTVTKEGATLGRSSDNKISIPDRELSRRHSKVDFDEKLGRFVVLDIGSTNGTYVQLVGPYAGRHKLNLNDHILVGRTGFSVNRFDYGLSEEMGHRQTMEDACAIVQHLNIGLLNTRELSPQSFFGVYDGHGGDKASLYLSQHLHVNIAGALVASVPAIMKARYEEDEASGAYPRMDEIVTKILKETFLRTDADFIGKSPSAQHGSTATTALVLGDRLYCANVGDSRTLLCRNFTPMAMSVDHKPAREDEAQRIRDAGGFVINNRVMGELAVSRAFGDSEFKKAIQQSMIEENSDMEIDASNWDQPLIIAEPEVKITTLTADDQFLLLACDGLFDVFSQEDIVTFVKKNMEEHMDAQRCCQNLTYDAIRKRNSRDNVSVILIILNKWY